jgi:hypothetical protein
MLPALGIAVRVIVGMGVIVVAAHFFLSRNFLGFAEGT